MNQDYQDYLDDPQNSTDSPKPKFRKTRKLEIILNICLIIAIVLCLAVISLRVFVFTRVEVRQTSMSPTYIQGETVWLSKVTQISRGCVAVFYEEDYDLSIWDIFSEQQYKLLIKRIVAIEGDQIWVEKLSTGNYRLIVQQANGGYIATEDNYYRGTTYVNIPDMNEDKLGRLIDHIGQDNAYTIPQGYFFAMGDNRNLSIDSREPNSDIPMRRLLGVVLQ